jgi:hypothetical protein
MHDETFRMLGREHEADLEREAAKRHLAAEVRGHRREAPRAPRPWRFARAFVARVLAQTRPAPVERAMTPAPDRGK